MWRALVLVIVAGFVDAVGFLALAGTFVAFMSGNTSAGGALAGTFDVARAARQLFPLPLFVGGIYLGALIVQAAPPEAQRRRYALVLAIECGLIALVLGLATLAGVHGRGSPRAAARFFGLAAPLAVAMGLQNAHAHGRQGRESRHDLRDRHPARGRPGPGPGHRPRPSRAGGARQGRPPRAPRPARRRGWA